MNVTGWILGALMLLIVGVGIYFALRSSASSADPASEVIAPPLPRPPKAVTAASIFWAVFGALWLFSLTAGAVFFIIRLMSEAL